nr:hypothetical protein [Pseudodesulfovibrio sp.]
MPFTGLETSLVTVVIAAIVGFFVRVRSVSQSDCKAQQDSMDIKFNTIFRMLRALITYSNMPEEKKVAILNQKGDD